MIRSSGITLLELAIELHFSLTFYELTEGIALKTNFNVVFLSRCSQNNRKLRHAWVSAESFLLRQTTFIW